MTMFIALEGIDGSGKGTHSKLLNEWVKEKGYETFLTKEPTEGKIGKLLREVLKSGKFSPETEALLFAADRGEHVKEISKKLAEGKVVITERYLYSSLAYQGASGVDIEWIKKINSFAPPCDFVMLLDVDPEVGLDRITSRNSLRSSMREKEHFEKKEFLGRVRDIYLDLAKEYGFVRIDASQGIKNVQTAIRRKVGIMLTIKEEEKTGQKGLNEF